MGKGSGTTRSSSSRAGNGLSSGGYPKTSLGDSILPFFRLELDTNIALRSAIAWMYPGVSFGSSGDNLTISSNTDNVDERKVVQAINDGKELLASEFKTNSDGTETLKHKWGSAEIINSGDGYKVWTRDENNRNAEGPYQFTSWRNAQRYAKERIADRYAQKHRNNS